MSDINEVFSTSKNDLQIGSDKKWWDWPNVRDMKKAANCCDKGKGPEKKPVKSLVFYHAGGVSEGSKKPNLYFGVKNGLKWPKKM